MNKKTVAYWIATALLALAMAGGGVVDLMKGEEVLQILARLGYPEYLATIIGVAKLLGTLAVLVPGMPRLKEWAYAGFAIDLIGAFASHLYVGDAIGDVMPPVVVLVIAMTSWALRPESRRLAA